MIKKILILISLFFISNSYVFAGETSYSNADAYTDLVSWSNPANGYTADSAYAIKNSTQYHSIIYYFPNFDLPDPVTPLQLVVSLKIKNDGARTHNIKPTLGGTPQGSTNNVSISSSDANNVVITYDLSTYTNITKSDLNTNHRVGVWIEKPGFPQSQTSIDEVKAKIVYSGSASDITLTNSEASASGQWVKLSLEGDTATASATMLCKIGVYQDCTRSGFASIKDNVPSAYIYLDKEHSQGSSTQIDGSNYYGYDWFVDDEETDTTWKADNIQVPYNGGFECSYKFSTYCSHKIISCDETGLHCVWTDSIVDMDQNAQNNSSLIVIPEVGLTTTQYSEAEPTNPLAWVVWSIKKMLWETFSPSSVSYSSIEFTQLKQQLEEREPFCYAYAMSKIDFSNTPSATSFPALTLPIAVANTDGIPTTYEFIPPTFLNNALSTVRTFLTFLFSSLFVLYVIQVARRIF